VTKECRAMAHPIMVELGDFANVVVAITISSTTAILVKHCSVPDAAPRELVS
ncbi:hypothetical protein NPIL_504411, partial [Nephila pilipes]